MIKNILALLLLFVSLLGYSQPANDDCTNATQLTNLNGGCVTVNNSGASYDTYVGGCFSQDNNNIWFYFTAQGTSVTIDVSGVNRPEFFISTGYSGDPCDITEATGIYCASGTGNYSSLSGTYNNLIVGETYYVQVDNNTGGGGGSGNVQLCIDNPVTTATDYCDGLSPFCTGSGTTFAASTSTTAPSGPDYDCLLLQPNPAWFYLEISTAGDIDISLTSSPAEDIDFVLWGPFTDYTDGCSGGIFDPANVVDCSFDAATSESASLVGTSVGETYILMITNFSGNPTDITATQSAGAGATDCTVVLPVEMLYCEVEQNQNKNVVKWTTASEINLSHFRVERSFDGTNFKEIGFLAGEGFSTTNKAYELIDLDVFYEKLFYRVVSVDFDGSYEESEVMVVNRSDFRETFTPVIYPNPSHGICNVDLKTLVEQNVRLNLFNSIGELVYAEYVSCKVGVNSFKFSLEDLPKGLYYIALDGEYDNKIVKFVLK